MTQDVPEESRPMTRFQKVASALRGDQPDRDPAGTENGQDYWDDESSAANAEPSAVDAERPVAVTRPDGLGAEAPDRAEAEAESEAEVEADAQRPDVTGAADDHQTTQPDMFGTTARPDPGEASVPAGAVTPTVPPEAAPGAAPEAAPGAAPGAVEPEETAPRADFNDIAYGNLIPEATQFREQWQQIQFKFVDDPRASVTEAADVVAQVSARLEAAIQERQRIITERQRSLRSRWDEGSKADTEALRGTLRMYRAFLDQLLGSR